MKSNVGIVSSNILKSAFSRVTKVRSAVSAVSITMRIEFYLEKAAAV